MLLVFSVQSASAWILSAYIYGLSEVMTISAIQDCFMNRQILATMKAIQKMVEFENSWAIFRDGLQGRN